MIESFLILWHAFLMPVIVGTFLIIVIILFIYIDYIMKAGLRKVLER